MSVKAIEVTTKDLMKIEEAIERKAPISEVIELLKSARLYHTSEQSLCIPVAELLKRVLWQYVVYPTS
jgi:hypothetical protein